MKKYNLGVLLAVATLLSGGCSDFYSNDNNIENVELDSVNEEIDDSSLVKDEKIEDEFNLLVDSTDVKVNSSSSTGSSSSSSSNNNSSNNNSSSSNGSSSSSGSTTPSNPTPPVAEQPKPQQPVDILDWNYIKSTLIAKGNSLGMILDTSLTRDNQGYESPWQSSYMPVTNEDVIGYIGSQMESVAKWGWEYFNLDMVVQADGNVLIYLIR